MNKASNYLVQHYFTVLCTKYIYCFKLLVIIYVLAQLQASRCIHIHVSVRICISSSKNVSLRPAATLHTFVMLVMTRKTDKKNNVSVSVFMIFMCVCVCVCVCVGTTYGSWPIQSWDQHRPLHGVSSNCKWINKYIVCIQTAFKHLNAMIRWCRMFCLFLPPSTILVN